MKSLLTLLVMFSVLLFGGVSNAEPVSYEAIHSAIVRLPVANTDRNDSYKEEQLRTISRAIEKVTQEVKWPDNDRVSLAAYLVTIGYHESRFSIKIQEGVKRAHSYGIWQVTPWAHKATRAQLIGLTQKETDSAALIAATAFSKSWNCGSSPADHFTAYYGGVKCGEKWKTLDSRVRTFWWIRNIISIKMKEENVSS